MSDQPELLEFAVTPMSASSPSTLGTGHQCGRKLTRNEYRPGLRSSNLDAAPLTANRRLTSVPAVTTRVIAAVANQLWIGYGRVSS